MLTIEQIGTDSIAFLDKISIMIKKITITLPAFEEYLETLHSRAIRNSKEKNDYNVFSRLLNALAYVYADMLQFCQEVCELFFKRRIGKWLSHGNHYGRPANIRPQVVLKKASFISTLAWGPFDKRFNDLILLFGNHKKLFELEMNVASNQEALGFYTTYEENMKNGENHRQN